MPKIVIIRCCSPLAKKLEFRSYRNLFSSGILMKMHRILKMMPPESENIIDEASRASEIFIDFWLSAGKTPIVVVGYIQTGLIEEWKLLYGDDFCLIECWTNNHWIGATLSNSDTAADSQSDLAVSEMAKRIYENCRINAEIQSNGVLEDHSIEWIPGDDALERYVISLLSTNYCL